MEKIAALEDAIEKKSLVGIYSVFYTIAHGDPNFSTGKFRQILDYVKSKGIDNLFQKYDGEEFEPEEQWDEDYWALIASSLVDNFCMERINHLEEVGRKVYPVKKSERAVPAQGRSVDRGPVSDGRITEEQKKELKLKHKDRTRSSGGIFGRINEMFGNR